METELLSTNAKLAADLRAEREAHRRTAQIYFARNRELTAYLREAMTPEAEPIRFEDLDAVLRAFHGC